MYGRKKFFLFFSLALSLVLFVSCVSKNKYLLKEDEIGKLSSDIDAMQSQYTTLEDEKNSLKDQLLALQADNKKLKSEAEAIELKSKEDITAMKSTYADLMDNMKSEVEEGNITITQLKDKLKVNMVDEILFSSGETRITPQGIEVLRRVGEILLNVKDKAINVGGYTDNVPIGPGLKNRYPSNWELSAARATNVVRYLQETTGIDPTLLSATGYGEYNPIASNETPEGQSKNRRIEILLVPKEILPKSRE
ncbi:MAG: OmpA family protein [Pseudomonadota bacterium]